MIKKVLLFFALFASSLHYATHHISLEDLEQYDLKDIGVMVCHAQDKNSEDFSEEQLIELGNAYLNGYKKLVQQIIKQSKNYHESGQESHGQIKSCQELWFKHFRKKCLEKSQEKLRTIIVQTSDKQKRIETLAEYAQAYKDQESTSWY